MFIFGFRHGNTVIAKTAKLAGVLVEALEGRRVFFHHVPPHCHLLSALPCVPW